MRRTSAGALIVAAVLGAGAGYLFDQVRTAAGLASFVPTVSLPALLVVLGAVIVVLAIPIHRATTGRSTTPVNPFRAVRIAMLAQASSLVGAVFTGVGAGLLGFALSRPVDPSLGSVGALIGTIVAAALLTAAGLVAEHLCTIRKDDDDKHPGTDSRGDDTGGAHPVR